MKLSGKEFIQELSKLEVGDIFVKEDKHMIKKLKMVATYLARAGYVIAGRNRSMVVIKKIPYDKPPIFFKEIGDKQSLLEKKHEIWLRNVDKYRDIVPVFYAVREYIKNLNINDAFRAIDIQKGYNNIAIKTISTYLTKYKYMGVLVSKKGLYKKVSNGPMFENSNELNSEFDRLVRIKRKEKGIAEKEEKERTTNTVINRPGNRFLKELAINAGLINN